MKKLEELENLNDKMLVVLNKRDKTTLEKALLQGIVEKDVP
eukprot:CAMPEP_0170564914 /NCGR_PEP_ID=MMETSP0211-20121228/75640_1 /TAXON_ID=311385 /ORGANISM="Pseudokeronopsis sp., Strain OXSARD2" /LENGTH=40 /DNA_ID= /DNA_START= /DNA_END= /DNA_ORIENTATION=